MNSLFSPSSLFVCIVILVVYAPLSHGCGTSTHISIAHEASMFFESSSNLKVNYADLIHKHQDAFVAGNPYPDAMYPSICFGGIYHQVAEDTHWAPFLNASINYIRKHYPQPWGEETEKLVAFVFGFVSHQVADITWHSLGIKQGFLRTMAAENFHNVYDTAHTDGDVGGDMLTQFTNDDKPVGLFKWYVPVTDLYNIYKEYYHGNRTVPKIVIELCSKLLYIEYIAEFLGGAEIFKPFVKKSPFLLNRLHDYFLGGIHDMASWTSLIWNETAYMMEHGTKNCNLTDNPLFIKCSNKSNSGNQFNPMLKNPGRAYPLLTGGWNDSDVSTLHTERGVYFYPGKAMENIFIDRMSKRNVKHIKSPKRYKMDSSNWYSSCPYANAGRSLALIKIQDKLNLVVGAPNHGEQGQPQIGHVYIIPLAELSERSENILAASEGVTVLKGPTRMSKFGWSLLSILYNDDGYEDLVISAPTLGAEKLQYFGKTFVYFGSKFGLSTHPNVTLDYFNQSTYTNFGYQLTRCKRNLLIGTPFDSLQKGLLLRQSSDNDNNSISMFGLQNYGWFGYSAECVTLNKEDIMFVGSPTFRKCFFKNCSYVQQDLQSIGAVDIFINNKRFLQLLGDSIFGDFGSSVSVGSLYESEDSVLAVSSPGKDIVKHIIGIPVTFVQAGEVTLYNVTSLLDDPTNVEGSILAKYQGDRAYARFGELVKFVDVDGDNIDELIISSPKRSTDLTEEFYGGEEGSVYIYKVLNLDSDKDCFSDNIKLCTQRGKAWKVFHGNEAHGRFGSSFQVVSMEGKTKIFISAPMSSHNSFQGGAVYSYDI